VTGPLTARDVLAEVLRVGRVIRDPEGPRVVVPPRLKPLVLTHRQALRALVLEGHVPLDEPPPSPPNVLRSPYSYPWPDALPGLGPRHIGPFGPCAECSSSSWVRFGALVLCLACVKRRERP